MVVLVEEKKRGSINRQQNVKYFPFLMFCVSIIGYLSIITLTILEIVYFLLSVMGLFVSLQIVKEKQGIDSMISKFCSISKKTDCQSVLNSRGAEFFYGISFSDISIVYFLSLVVLFVLKPDNSCFFILSLLSLPIIIYSIYYQNFEIKKWCPLCLGIAVILLFQFLILLFNSQGIRFQTQHILFYFIVVIGAVGFWALLKPLLLKKYDNKELIIENLSFRRKHHLFLPFYKASRKIDTSLNQNPDIQLGSKSPIITITAITNPLCETCFDVHSIYSKLLKRYPQEIQINFRFFVPFEHRNDPRTQISERFLQLYFEEEYHLFVQAFNEWYSKISINEWLDKWGECEDNKYNDILRSHKKWCSNYHIDNTPTILINGKFFPNIYNPIDIENFVQNIIDIEKCDRKKSLKNIHA